MDLNSQNSSGRRSGIDRRQFSYSTHIPERRVKDERRGRQPERREGADRRCGIDRRKSL